MFRRTLLLFVMGAVVASPACRDEAVGVGDPDRDGAVEDAALPRVDAAPDQRCQDWSPPAPGELAVWSSSEGVGERHAAAAVGNDGTLLAVWATEDGVWCRARCHNGAPLREGGLDTRLDDGAALSLTGPYVTALAEGGFVVTWRDDTDASIRAVWIDSVGAPVGPAAQLNVEEAEAAGRPPMAVQLTDGDVLILWSYWYVPHTSDGVALAPAPRVLNPPIESDPSIAAVAGVGNTLHTLRWLYPPPSPTTALEFRLTTWAISTSGVSTFVSSAEPWPHLWNWGLRGYVLAAVPDVERAAVIWPGNYPYEVWLRWVDTEGIPYGDGLVLGDGGVEAPEQGWMDLAMDGLGQARVVWRTADVAPEILTWTEASEDQLLMTDWGERPHYPRLAGYPDGGFVLLLSPAESHPDEDVLFTLLDR